MTCPRLASVALLVALFAAPPARAQDGGPPPRVSPPAGGAAAKPEPKKGDEDPPLSPEEQKKHDAEVKRLVEELRSQKNKEMMQSRLAQLGAQGGRVNRDALMAYAKGNKNQEFVESAFKALAKIGGKKVVEYLCDDDALKFYNQFLVQIAAANALAEMKDARAADALLEVMKLPRSKIEVIGACCHAAAKSAPNDKRISDEVLRHCGNKDDTVRANAMEAAGHLKSDAAYDRLVEALFKDGNTRVRGAAASGLMHLGRKEALPHLQKAVDTDKSETVKALAMEAIKALGAVASR